MMIRINNFLFAILLFSAFLVGCQKSAPLGHEIAFDVELAGDCESASETRSAGRYTATDLNTIGQFNVWGYDGTTKDIDNRIVKRFTSGIWGFEDSPMIWTEGHTRTFWACANLPSYVTFTNNSSTKSTLTVTPAGIPSQVADQWDPLVGYYSGTGSNGKATIVFNHPFTAVSFTTGSTGEAKYNITGIKSVKMKNVHKSGSATTSNGSTYSWTPSGTTDVTGAFTGTSSTAPFLLIPQTLSTNNVTLEITVTRSSGGDKVMYATLNTGSWTAGSLNVYTLDYNNDTMTATLTVSLQDWGTVVNTSTGKNYFEAQFD